MADESAHLMVTITVDTFEVLKKAINIKDVALAERLDVFEHAPIFPIRNLLSADACAAYCNHIDSLFATGKFTDYKESPPKFGLHNDDVGLALAYFLRASVEMRTGMKLKPSCTFCAIYPNGSEFKRHIDRAECEVTVAIYVQDSITCQGPRVLLKFGPIDCPTAFRGSVGDAVIFFGSRTAHWRDAVHANEDSLTALLLHYTEMP